MPFKVLIIGAGLSGTLLANGLLKHSIECTLYERDTADAPRKGYQIRLGAPALHGFRECLSPEIKDAICAKFGRSGGAVASAPVMYNTRMQLLVDLTKFPAYPKSAPIDRVVLRDALAEPVARQGRIVYGKVFVRYEVFGEGRQKVRAYFADGTTDEGDVLVAADGSSSKVCGFEAHFFFFFFLRQNHDISLEMVVILLKHAYSLTLLDQCPSRPQQHNNPQKDPRLPRQRPHQRCHLPFPPPRDQARSRCHRP